MLSCGHKILLATIQWNFPGYNNTELSHSITVSGLFLDNENVFYDSL